MKPGVIRTVPEVRVHVAFEAAWRYPLVHLSSDKSEVEKGMRWR